MVAFPVAAAVEALDFDAAVTLLKGADGEGAEYFLQLAGLQVPEAERPGVWLELARVREIAGDFDEAERVLREGLGATHFSGKEHQQFFRRLVRLHERAGTLAELEDGLRETAESGKEGALVELEQFYAMTLRPDERAGVLATLEGKFPAKPEYGVELVRVLRGLDRDTEARVVAGRIGGAGG